MTTTKMSNFDKIMQVVVFTIAILVILLFWKLEKRDFTCGDENDCSTCDKGYSMPTYAGRLQKGDSKEEIKEKISFLARYEKNTILWRRIALISIIISFLVTYIVTRKFPYWKTFLVVLIVVYFVLYLAEVIYRPITADKAVCLIDRQLQKV